MEPMPEDQGLTPLQRYSAPILFQLARVPKWLLLVAVLGLTVGGLLLDNAIGGVLLLFLALFLAWLAILGWTHLSLIARLLRLIVVGLVVFVAFTRLV